MRSAARAMRARLAWRQRLQRWRARRRDPATALFRGLRIRLTLWYSGVLAVSMLLAGIGLYFGAERLVLQPITRDVDRQVALMAQDWAREERPPCPLPGTSGGSRATAPVSFYAVCFEVDEEELRPTGDVEEQDPEPPHAFLDDALARRAIAQGTASDIVDGGDEVGALYRSAQLVRDPSSGSVLGVVQGGRSIAEQQSALSALRTILLVLGGVALLVATLGGLFLSGRALAPARLAFARQQAFIADASHELRTPLTLLRANAEVLLRRRHRLDPEDAALLEDIVAETAHMDHLASNLLTLARLDAGRLQLEYEVVDLSELAAAIARRVTALAAERRIEVDVVADGPAVVVGDRRALEQAALILVDNALKYSPPGGRVTLRTGTSDGEAHLAVTDTGVGIDPAHLPRLGERFYRVDKARSRETGGVGLGLAIARGIATAHGGALRIESQPGRGTTATLAFPANGPGRAPKP
ncbi:MAG: ATP-binding protein [Sphaerobacter sp.]|nr:ATP-binding protein [Sphaerobacter sp.]